LFDPVEECANNIESMQFNKEFIMLYIKGFAEIDVNNYWMAFLDVMSSVIE